MIEEDKRQFFANKVGPHHTINMGGKKLALANFPKEMQRKIMNKLTEKDPVLALGDKGILPGIKINGRQVTRENIHEFEKKDKKEVKEIKEVQKEEKKEEVKPIPSKKAKKATKKKH